MTDPITFRHAGRVPASRAANDPLPGAGPRHKPVPSFVAGAGVTIGLAFSLLLAACGSSQEAGDNGADTAGQTIEQAPSNLQDDPNNSVVPLTTPTPSPTPLSSLPAAFHGRWGMVANDCDPARADAKGLMTVSADRLDFYESRARIGKATVLRPGTIRLDLAFTGEGQEWTRQTILTLLDDGRTLVAETPADPEPPMRSLRYSRCPA